MNKHIKITIFTCLAIITNLAPMFLQGIESIIPISYAILWFSITVSHFKSTFFYNKLSNSVIDASLITGPSTVLIFTDSITGYIWTIL